jgi:hypothetical protein
MILMLRSCQISQQRGARHMLQVMIFKDTQTHNHPIPQSILFEKENNISCSSSQYSNLEGKSPHTPHPSSLPF